MADQPEKKPRVRLPVVVDELDRQVERGAMFHYSMHTTALDKAHELAAFVYAGIELMMQKGLCTKEEVRQMVAAVKQELDKKHWTKTQGYIFNPMEHSKYDAGATRLVDCEARMHLCKGVCCHFNFPLQVGDVHEGVVKWDLGKPYWIRKDEEGSCVHLRKDNGQCNVFEQRPLICRMYSCINDKRVWLDFENRIPNTENIAQAMEQREDVKMMLETVELGSSEDPAGPKGSTP